MLVEGSNRTLRKWHTCRIRSKLGSRGGNQRHVLSRVEGSPCSKRILVLQRASECYVV